MRRFERFGDDFQAKCIADLSHAFPAFFAESLESVGRGSRFPHAASKEARTVLLNCLCYSERLVTIFDRARPGDDGELACADRRVVDTHNSFLRTQIESDQLVGLRNANNFGNSREIFKTPAIDWTLVSCDANRGACRAGHR